MADIADRALKEQQIHAEAAISVQLSRNGVEEPLYDGLKRICLDCKKPIPEKRLVANPNAVRCVPCQAIKDERDKAERGR